MKNFLFISLIGLLIIPLNKAYSQYVVEISVDQPPVLEADAGSDKSINEGESVQIGGTLRQLAAMESIFIAGHPIIH